MFDPSAEVNLGDGLVQLAETVIGYLADGRLHVRCVADDGRWIEVTLAADTVEVLAQARASEQSAA